MVWAYLAIGSVALGALTAVFKLVGKNKSMANAMRSVAEEQLLQGAVEIPLGSNNGKFVKLYFEGLGVNPPANWCAAFVTFCMKEGCKRLGIQPPVKGSAGAKSLQSQFQGIGQWFSADQIRKDPALLSRCDIFYEHRGEEGAWTGHTGIIMRAEGRNYVTIEGNAGTAGDRVASMIRKIDDARFLGASFLEKAGD